LVRHKLRQTAVLGLVVALAATACSDDDTVAPGPTDAGFEILIPDADLDIAPIPDEGPEPVPDPGPKKEVSKPDAPQVEPDEGDTEPVCVDSDRDGFLPASCDGGDCDDSKAAVHPLATEVCGDGLDNDCDGVVDNVDADDDGVIAAECGGGDCDDADPLVGPGMVEVCFNEVDEDCSGQLDDLDLDHDGAPSAECGGMDCDDENPLVFPGALDLVLGYCTASASWNLDLLIEISSTFASLAIDSKDHIYLVFQGADTTLQLGEVTPDGFEVEQVDSGAETGSNLEVTVDYDDVLHISYLDLPKQSLSYATNKPGYFVHTLVDQGFVGWFSSIGVTSEGIVHIAYHDVDQKDLRHATCVAECHETSSWVAKTVTDQGEVGQFSSMALSQSGLPHISFRDQSSETLRSAIFDLDEGDWVLQTIDKGIGVGWTTSLAVGAFGDAHVSYYDQGTATLKYAWRDKDVWHPQTVANAPIIDYGGQSTSLKLDPAGGLHIAFTDDSSHGLKYARCSQLCGVGCCEGSWALVGVDTNVVVGQAAALGITAAGQVVIGYTAGKPPDGVLNLATAPCIDSGLDNNCDGVDGIDADGDGFASVASGGTDCQDAISLVHPAATDPPGDDVDWNCDGED